MVWASQHSSTEGDRSARPNHLPWFTFPLTRTRAPLSSIWIPEVAAFRVKVWDVYREALDRARSEFDANLEMLFNAGVGGAAVEKVLARVSWHLELDDAVSDAGLIQECIPEQLGMKRELFAQLSAITRKDAVLASSTSALKPSDIAELCDAKIRMLVGHPANPPFLLPVIEVVPSNYTAKKFVDRAIDLYARAALKPVLVGREVEGFVFNRLQGALLREAYCLVRDGVAAVADIDEIVRLGLGRRWSVIGPFETVDLNTRGGIEAEARESERRYREMQMELAHANRAATMGQLTASIAHEVQQPIGATAVNAAAALRSNGCGFRSDSTQRGWTSTWDGKKWLRRRVRCDDVRRCTKVSA